MSDSKKFSVGDRVDAASVGSAGYEAFGQGTPGTIVKIDADGIHMVWDDGFDDTGHPYGEHELVPLGEADK